METYLDRAVQVERHAELLGGLFVGSFWLIVVVVVGAVLLHIINRRFDP